MGLPPEIVRNGGLDSRGQSATPETGTRSKRPDRRLELSAGLQSFLQHGDKRRGAAGRMERSAESAVEQAAAAGVELPREMRQEIDFESRTAGEAHANLDKRVAQAKSQLRALIAEKQNEVDRLQAEADKLSGFTLSRSRKEKHAAAVAAAEAAQQQLDELYNGDSESESRATAARQLGMLRDARKAKAKYGVMRKRTEETHERMERRIAGKGTFMDSLHYFVGDLRGTIYEEMADAIDAQEMEPKVSEQYNEVLAAEIGDAHIAKLEEAIALTRENIAERGAQDRSLYTKYYEQVGRVNMEQLFDVQGRGKIERLLLRTMTVDRFARYALTGAISITAGATVPAVAAAGLVGMRAANAILFYERGVRQSRKGELRQTTTQILTADKPKSVISRLSSSMDRLFGKQPDMKLAEMNDEMLLQQIGDLLAWSEASGVRIGANMLDAGMWKAESEVGTMTAADALNRLLQEYGQRLSKERTPEQTEQAATETGAVLESELAEVDRVLAERFTSAQEREKWLKVKSAAMAGFTSIALPEIMKATGFAQAMRDTISDAWNFWTKDEVDWQAVSEVVGDAAKWGLENNPLIGTAHAEAYDHSALHLQNESEYAGEYLYKSPVKLHIGSRERGMLQEFGLELDRGTFVESANKERFLLPVISREQAAAIPGVNPTTDVTVEWVRTTDAGVVTPKFTFYDGDGNVQYHVYAQGDPTNGIKPTGNDLRQLLVKAQDAYVRAVALNPDTLGKAAVNPLDALPDNSPARLGLEEAVALHSAEADPTVIEERLIDGKYRIRIPQSDIEKLTEKGFVGFNDGNSVIYQDERGKKGVLRIPFILDDKARGNENLFPSSDIVLSERGGTVTLAVFDTRGDLQFVARGHTFEELQINANQALEYERLDRASSMQYLEDQRAATMTERSRGMNPVQPDRQSGEQVYRTTSPYYKVPEKEPPFRDVPLDAAAQKEMQYADPAEVLASGDIYNSAQIQATLTELASSRQKTLEVNGHTIRAFWKYENPGVPGSERHLYVKIDGVETPFDRAHSASVIKRLQEIGFIARMQAAQMPTLTPPPAELQVPKSTADFVGKPQKYALPPEWSLRTPPNPEQQLDTPPRSWTPLRDVNAAQAERLERIADQPAAVQWFRDNSTFQYRPDRVDPVQEFVERPRPGLSPETWDPIEGGTTLREARENYMESHPGATAADAREAIPRETDRSRYRGARAEWGRQQQAQREFAAAEARRQVVLDDLAHQPEDFGNGDPAADAAYRESAYEKFQVDAGTSVLKIVENGQGRIAGDEELGIEDTVYDKKDGTLRFERTRGDKGKYEVIVEGSWNRKVDSTVVKQLLRSDWKELVKRGYMGRDASGHVVATPPPKVMEMILANKQRDVYRLAQLYEGMVAMEDAGVDRQYVNGQLVNTEEYNALIKEIQRLEKDINDPRRILAGDPRQSVYNTCDQVRYILGGAFYDWQRVDDVAHGGAQRPPVDPRTYHPNNLD